MFRHRSAAFFALLFLSPTVSQANQMATSMHGRAICRPEAPHVRGSLAEGVLYSRAPARYEHNVFPYSKKANRETESELLKKNVPEPNPSCNATCDYEHTLTPAEKESIYVFLQLLERGAPFSQAEVRSLYQTRCALSHVHPLRSLEYILTDYDLFQLLQDIYSKESYGWSLLSFHYKSQLEEEWRLNNLREEQLNDFFANIGADPDEFYPLIEVKSWNDFLKRLTEVE